ncbi:uncharacterized protein NESG_01292 [Nematocida ausubeli]|uniref:Uncharacterized protein n=1 Tax=Nematocida ausubeli (strain ATCC PRA-371 / ERTm2) TaxID=1913371 RepID=A0A086J208_NEMA1|nr:uncharacterized protein NESG_01292 [Nematocida ausubeli]KAI5135173.1 hypothetical protein NEAUS06_1412 [Nematocida ausubeli]KFG26176.1 hypothetical protein NESG_01292 [Nematocida ausubeli]
MGSEINVRNSRQFDRLSKIVSEEEKAQQEDRWKSTKRWLVDNKHCITTAVLLLICLGLNLDKNMNPNSFLPCKFFSITLLKYGILANLNLLTTIITLFFSLLHKSLIENMYLTTLIISTINGISNSLDRSMRFFLANKDTKEAWYTGIIQSLYKTLSEYTTNEERADQITGVIENSVIFSLEKARIILIWISLFFNAISLFSYIYFSFYGIGLIIGNFHLLPVYTSYTYNIIMRVIPFIAIIYDRISFTRRKNNIYYSNYMYYMSLVMYVLVLVVINIIAKLSENIWLYSFFDNISISVFSLYAVPGIITAAISFFIIFLVNLLYKGRIVAIYDNIMQNGIEAYCKNSVGVINTMLSILCACIVMLCMYKLSFLLCVFTPGALAAFGIKSFDTVKL